MKRKFNTTIERAKIMASIRSKDTKPEILLRKELQKHGIRNYRKYKKLPGKPDLCFSKKKLIVFVDGCFWHGCPKHFRKPKNNNLYWSRKIKSNIKRKVEVNTLLKRKGYKILRIWEHQILKIPERIALKISHLLK